MIEQILPGSVTAVETFDEIPADLYPDEQAVVRWAVPKRREEFTTVRHCARTALSRIGVAPGPILPDPWGAPQWPRQVVGSMTHCSGYRAAAVADVHDVASIGVDAEPHESLPDRVVDMVASPQERHHLHDLATACPHIWWDRLLFSVKESVYKAWYPLTKVWLDFDGVEVTIDPAQRRFSARVVLPASSRAEHWPKAFDGRFLVGSGLVLTAVVQA